ncbi:MAG: hypothetical protein ACREFJ_10800 [Acetobacteraceae bacterium]
MTANADSPDVAERRAPDLLAPLTIGLLALILFLGLQISGLLQTRANLGQIHARQDTEIASATRVRQQLQTLANGTAALAGQGNAHAKAIIAALAHDGVTIHPGTKP